MSSHKRARGGHARYQNIRTQNTRGRRSKGTRGDGECSGHARTGEAKGQRAPPVWTRTKGRGVYKIYGSPRNSPTHRNTISKLYKITRNHINHIPPQPPTKYKAKYTLAVQANPNQTPTPNEKTEHNPQYAPFPKNFFYLFYNLPVSRQYISLA